MIYICFFHVCVCARAAVAAGPADCRVHDDVYCRILTYAQIRMLTRSRSSTCSPCPSYQICTVLACTSVCCRQFFFDTIDNFFFPPHTPGSDSPRPSSHTEASLGPACRTPCVSRVANKTNKPRHDLPSHVSQRSLVIDTCGYYHPKLISVFHSRWTTSSSYYYDYSVNRELNIELYVRVLRVGVMKD